MRKLALFIALSLMLHFSSYTGVSAWFETWKKNNPTVSLTQIEITEEKPLKQKPEKQRPIVKQLETTRPIDYDEKARFESEKTIRVAVETKATQTGVMANATNPVPEDKQQKYRTADEDGSLPEFTRLNNSKNSLQYQVSKVSIELPNDIQNASTTNLNTDATTYYSFYNRVEELFYVRWIERLNYYWERIPLEFKKEQLAGKKWRTQVTVLLNSSGIYESSIIDRSSGYSPFDEAVIFAFKDAHFFPNVPKAKVEPDGRVRLRYSFSVNIGSYP